IAGELYDIPQIEVDLTPVKEEFLKAIGDNFCDAYASEKTVRLANANINPRLRMSVLYAIGQMRGYLVAGTGNKDEITMGYFTKWGDGACDFNPIADLTVAEVYDFLRFLGAPNSIIEKKPSAGLYPGQTDELEMGISYDEVDKYLKGEEVSENSKKIIESAKAKNAHKLAMPKWYKEGDFN
ncbi:MAG: NAD(+) synthase, partial [Clostridia bacterium]